MQTNLLLLLIANLLWLPTAHTQSLTTIPDTASKEAYDPDSYVAIGLTGRVILGYQQMRDLYEGQGFESLRLQEFVTIGLGLDLGDRFNLNFGFDRFF